MSSGNGTSCSVRRAPSSSRRTARRSIRPARARASRGGRRAAVAARAEPGRGRRRRARAIYSASPFAGEVREEARVPVAADRALPWQECRDRARRSQRLPASIRYSVSRALSGRTEPSGDVAIVQAALLMRILPRHARLLAMGRWLLPRSRDRRRVCARVGSGAMGRPPADASAEAVPGGGCRARRGAP